MPQLNGGALRRLPQVPAALCRLTRHGPPCLPGVQPLLTRIHFPRQSREEERVYLQRGGVGACASKLCDLRKVAYLL